MEDSPIYFIHGEVIAESGNAKVYKMEGELFLELGPGHNLWALESEFYDYADQLYDWPRGNCLEIGLGLGVASRYILTFPKVKHLTTVEINEDVIKAHAKIKESDRKFDLGYDKEKHRILNAHGLHYAYTTKKKYDFIFLDFYAGIDEDTLPEIADMLTACKHCLDYDGRIVGWLDKHTPGDYAQVFMDMF